MPNLFLLVSLRTCVTPCIQPLQQAGMASTAFFHDFTLKIIVKCLLSLKPKLQIYIETETLFSQDATNQLCIGLLSYSSC